MNSIICSTVHHRLSHKFKKNIFQLSCFLISETNYESTKTGVLVSCKAAENLIGWMKCTYKTLLYSGSWSRNPHFGPAPAPP